MGMLNSRKQGMWNPNLVNIITDLNTIRKEYQKHSGICKDVQQYEKPSKKFMVKIELKDNVGAGIVAQQV